MLVIIRADEYAEKDVLGIMDGFRENVGSWRGPLRSLNKRGTNHCARFGLWGRCIGLSNRTAGRVPKHERTALLGPQNGQYHRRHAQANA